MKKVARYSSITEYPGLRATTEQIERLYHRYRFSTRFTAEKDVLEVACGSGIGLGYLANNAASVVGGDIDEANVKAAKKRYENNKKISVLILDAQSLPFEDSTFDVVLCHEAIYYLKEPEQFIREAFRVLKNGGWLIIGSVNKDWKDFHPSKYSRKYLSVPELNEMLIRVFKNAELFGAFEVKEEGVKEKIFSFLKVMASRLHIIPGNLKSREILKRIFIGKLSPIPDQIFEGMAEYDEPIKIRGNAVNRKYKIIYAVAVKNGDK